MSGADLGLSATAAWALTFLALSSVILGGAWLIDRLRLWAGGELPELGWRVAIVAALATALPPSVRYGVTVELPLLPSATTVSAPGEASDTSSLLNDVDGYVAATHAPLRTPPLATGAVLDAHAGAAPAHRASAITTAAATAGVGSPPFHGRWVKTPAELRESQSAQAWSSPSLATALMCLWLLGACALLGKLALDYGRAARAFGARTPLPPVHRACALLEALCATAKVRRPPRLTRSCTLGSPVSLLGSEICIPDWALEELDDTQLRALLAHELAHQRRADPLWLALLQVIERVFFFQPLFRLAHARMRALAELAADDWAAACTRDGRAIAATLYACVARAQGEAAWGIAIVAEPSMLVRRVQRLLAAQGAKPSLLPPAGRVALCALSFAIALALPSFEVARAADRARDIPPLPATPVVAPAPEVAAAPASGPAPEQAPTPTSAPRPVELPDPALAPEPAAVSAPAPAPAPAVPAAPTPTLAAVPEALHMRAPELAPVPAAAPTPEAAPAPMLAPEPPPAPEPALPADPPETMLAAAPRHVGIHQHNDHNEVDFTRGKEALKASWDGDFELNADESDVVRLDRGAQLEIETRRGDVSRRVRFVEHGGQIERTFDANGKTQPIDADARTWIASTLQSLLRASAVHAQARVQRLLARGGTDAVFNEMDQMAGSYPLRVYAEQLIAQAELTDADVRRLCKTIARVDGDYDLRVILTTLLAQEHVSPATLPDLVEVARRIDGDYDQRNVLEALAQQPLTPDLLKAYGEIAGHIDSAYDLRVAITAALANSATDGEVAARLLDLAATSVHGDYDLSQVVQSAPQVSASDAATAAAIRAADAVGSSYDRRTSVEYLVDHAQVNAENWVALIDAVRTMDSDYDRAEALTRIAATMPRDDAIVAAYERALDAIGSEHDRGRAREALMQ